VNFLWAGHITHHSSEHLNFSNGFRTSLFQGVNRILFIGFIPVFGFSPLMLLITFKISGLYDFLLQTTYVRKLGILEKFMVTPSHHRVHHGRNDIYIDKNYSSTFIIWDKIFGTFQEETEPVEYGVKGNYVDNDPVNAVTYYYKYMLQVMKQRSGWREKLNVLVISPDRTKLEGMKEETCMIEEVSLLPYFNSYAWFHAIAAVAGMIMLLLFINNIPATAFTLLAAAGVSSICAGAMVLNGRFGEKMINVEMTRNLLFAFVFVFVCWLTPKFYLLIPMYFSVLSLVILVRAREKYLIRDDMT
jgi:hypothetical protein